jgi:serine/threonine-protein kinase RsbT
VENDFQRLTQLLERYLSRVNAHAMVQRVLREHGISPVQATRRDFRKCSAALRRGIELFVPQSKRESALNELAEFCGSDSLRPEAYSLDVRTEGDLGTARAQARRICDRANADSFAMQRVATIVSELARNILLYAKTGTVEVLPMTDKPRRIVVRALDAGPGIQNLDRVMSGQYQSKTGLGRGLFGSRRLADRFEISTGTAGTTVVAEVFL